MIHKHNKPIESSPSVFLIRAFENYCSFSNPVLSLDIPCGFGRHSLYLSQEGHNVVCADYDAEVFLDHWFKANNKLSPIRLDARKELPFKPRSFDLITIIHFYSERLFEEVNRALKKDGIVIFESFGGQGGNWKDLPIKGRFIENLRKDFEILYYKQKIVGPAKNNITVKLIARKS